MAQRNQHKAAMSSGVCCSAKTDVSSVLGSLARAARLQVHLYGCKTARSSAHAVVAYYRPASDYCCKPRVTRV